MFARQYSVSGIFHQFCTMLYTADQIAQLPASGFRYLFVSSNDHVLTITLNRPEKKNALSPPMLAELAFALAYAHYTPDVWLVVLAATGNVFCAGMDLKSLAEGSTEAATVPDPSGPVRLGELMAGLHKPCIARVQGPVYAGGFLLVGGSTYVVAAESATFTLPEVKRGLFPFQVLAVLLDIMPYRQAIDLCLRARTIPASEAKTLGLVTYAVPADGLDATMRLIIEELRLFSPTAMQFGLRAAQELKSLPPREQQAFMHDQFQQLQQTPDAREGIAAFLEKRLPKWS